jgi:hypothetical protein
MYVATHKASIFNIMGAWMSQVVQELSTFLQRNHMEEKVVNMLYAKLVKGKRVEFDFELTSIMLSRALFANSCSIEVDGFIRVSTHTKDSKNNVCAW